MVSSIISTNVLRQARTANASKGGSSSEAAVTPGRRHMRERLHERAMPLRAACWCPLSGTLRIGRTERVLAGDVAVGKR